MRDLRGALALARQKVLETSGNSGNSGNTAEKVSRNKQLPDLHVVSTAADAVATVETKAEAVATVASPSELVETPSITDESESEQQLTQPVASVSSVSTENGANPEELDERTWWDDVMAAIPPCSRHRPFGIGRVRQKPPSRVFAPHILEGLTGLICDCIGLIQIFPVYPSPPRRARRNRSDNCLGPRIHVYPLDDDFLLLPFSAVPV